MFIPLHPREGEAAKSDCAEKEARDTPQSNVTISDKTVIKFGVGITFAIVFLCILIALLWFQPWRKWKRSISTRDEQSPFMGEHPETREMCEAKQPAHLGQREVPQQTLHQIHRKPVPLQRRLTIKLPRHISAATRSRTPEDQLTSLGPDEYA